MDIIQPNNSATRPPFTTNKSQHLQKQYTSCYIFDISPYKVMNRVLKNANKSRAGSTYRIDLEQDPFSNRNIN